MGLSRTAWVAALLIGLKLWVVGLAPLLADEAYYWVWSQDLQLGYYDQPPLTAWMLRFQQVLVGESERAVRLGAVLCAAIGMASLWNEVEDKALWVLGWFGIPGLVGLTGFITPDAPLIALWSIGLLGSLRGGRWWWVVGAAWGLACLAKHSGLALFPLCWLGMGAPRDRDVLTGLLLGLLILSPHLWWLGTHEWVTISFQANEGWYVGRPGLSGPIWVILQQLAVTSPLVGLAMVGASIADREDGCGRLVYWTSGGLLLFFLVSSLFGQPEAHWLAPTWVGGWLIVCRSHGWTRRAGEVGAWMGVLGILLVLWHVQSPLLGLPKDPAGRLSEGPLVAQWVEDWVTPVADDSELVPVVYTERYQEAAFLRYYARIDASVYPGCGRRSELDGTDRGPGYFLRPATSGPLTCTGWSETKFLGRFEGQEPDTGRVVGLWQLFQLETH